MAVLCQMLKWKVKQKHSKATLAQLGERQTEVSSVNSSEGLVFDPQKSQNFFFFLFFFFSILLSADHTLCLSISQLIMHNYDMYLYSTSHA